MDPVVLKPEAQRIIARIIAQVQLRKARQKARDSDEGQTTGPKSTA
ncbi:hypothetical protein GCM10025857_03280 [Alicyclobacillus contaminans]|nr:hypothetical protein [Alicyclobacillus contaminans]GMA48971.1 hypothetical protein GCM10025857_03280 [Alicyclobacillus contaminans]